MGLAAPRALGAEGGEIAKGGEMATRVVEHIVVGEEVGHMQSSIRALVGHGVSSAVPKLGNMAGSGSCICR